jgi:hypothetical protein
MTDSKTKIQLGFKAKTGFGRKGQAKGMYSGGFNYYVYGLWPFISITHYSAWGGFCHNNPNLK